MEVPDEAVVNPKPLAVKERVAVGLLDRRASGGVDVGEEERRHAPGLHAEPPAHRCRMIDPARNLLAVVCSCAASLVCRARLWVFVLRRNMSQ
jgi:hypothetical protein